MRQGVLAATAVALLAACSGGGGPGRKPAPTSTTPAPPPTTATTTPGATTTTVALIPQETPELAATALFAAWRDHDRHAALVVAVPAAVDTLFGQPVASSSDRGCQQPLDGRSSCAFGIGGQAAIAQVQTVTLAGGWVVQSVVITPNQ